MNREAGFTRGGLLALIGEVSFIALFGLAGFAVFSYWEVFESLSTFTRDYERWQVDEFFGGILFGAVAICGLLVVRWGRERIGTQRLYESERRFERLFDGTADALIVSTPKGRILDLNEQAVNSLKFSRKELIGASVFDVEIGFEPGDHPEVWERLVAGEKVLVEGINRRKDGSTFPVEIRITLIDSGEKGRRMVFSSIRDVSDRSEALKKLRDTRDTNWAILALVPDAVCWIDSEGNYLDVVHGSDRELLVTKEEVIGSNVRQILGEETGARFMQKVYRAFETGAVQAIEYPIRSRDGEDHFIESRIVACGAGRAIYFARDITRLHQTVKKLNESESRNRAIVEAVPDLIFRFDRDGVCLDLHAEDESALLAPKEELIGKNLREVIPENAFDKYQRAAAEAVRTGEVQVFEYEMPGRETFRYREIRIVASGSEGEMICFVRNVDERKEFESRVRRLAYRDQLTGLPNRTAFTEKLERVMASGRHRPVMLLMDIQDFARINSSLGREAGDRLLGLLADEGVSYLERMGQNDAYFSRYGGNEFATLLKGCEMDQVRRIITSAIGRYRDIPILLDGVEVFLRPKIGVVQIEPGDDPAEVLRRSAVAVREAKRDPDALYKIYDEEMGRRSSSELSLEADLRRAIEEEELSVCYQPEVYLDSGRIYSLEALARWNHPERGAVSPAEFIPIAEDTGLILPLGEYVLREACRQMSLWNTGIPDLAPCTVSVNVSALQLRQAGFVEKVRQAIEDNGLEPRRLQIEITESAAAADFDTTLRTFTELRRLGVRVALDDFGTGYSSLSYLTNFPLDALKLDRSFISEVATDRRTAQVVSSIVNIAHALDLRVVGEGIEKAEQMEALDLLDCDIGQGYYIARPISREETFSFLKGRSRIPLKMPGSPE